MAYQNHTFKTLAALVGNTSVTSTKLVRRSEITNTNFYGSTQYMKLSSSCASTNSNYCLTTNDVTTASYAAANIYLGYYNDEYNINNNISGSCKFAIGFEDSGTTINRKITNCKLRTSSSATYDSPARTIEPQYPPIYEKPYIYLPGDYTARIYYSLLIFKPIVTSNNDFWPSNSSNNEYNNFNGSTITGSPYVDPYLGSGTYGSYSYPNPTSFGTNRVFLSCNPDLWNLKNKGYGAFFCKCMSGYADISSSDGTVVSSASGTYYYVSLVDKLYGSNTNLYNFLKDRFQGNRFSCTIEEGYMQPVIDPGKGQLPTYLSNYGFCVKYQNSGNIRNIPFYGPMLAENVVYNTNYGISRTNTFSYSANSTTYSCGGFGINVSPMSSILFFDCMSANTWQSKMVSYYASSIAVSSSTPSNASLFAPTLKAVLHIGAVDITPNVTAASLKSSGYKYFNFYKADYTEYFYRNGKRRLMPCRRINFLGKNAYDTSVQSGAYYTEGGGYVGWDPYQVNIW